MKKINKKKLAKRVSKRLGNAVPEAVIYDTITIICNELSDKLERERSICIDNFGVLDVCDVAGHAAQNIDTGEAFLIQDRSTVKFIPNELLKYFLSKRNYKKE